MLGLLFMVILDLFSSKIIVLQTVLLFMPGYTCKISAKINISSRVKQNMILVISRHNSQDLQPTGTKQANGSCYYIYRVITSTLSGIH